MKGEGDMGAWTDGDYTQFCTTHIERAMCLEVEQNQKVDMKKTLGSLGC